MSLRSILTLCEIGPCISVLWLVQGDVVLVSLHFRSPACNVCIKIWQQVHSAVFYSLCNACLTVNLRVKLMQGQRFICQHTVRSGPNLIELLSTTICLAWNCCHDISRTTKPNFHVIFRINKQELNATDKQYVTNGNWFGNPVFITEQISY